MNSKTLKHTRLVVVHALFCAVAYLLMFMLRISGIGGFLTFDAKDAVIIIASMIFGPLSGIIIAFTVAFIEMVTVSATGVWGAIMNFCSSAVFAAVSSVIYNYCPRIKKKLSGAIIGLSVGCASTVIVMLIMNLIITPIYTKMPVSVIASMIVPLLLPFNLIKTILNASIVMLLYKSVSNILKRSGFIAKSDNSANIRFSKYTVAVFAVSAVIAAICAMLLIFTLGGQFTLFK